MTADSAVACMQFLQTAHPPARKFKGRVPRVHRGFHATWAANGLSARILSYVQRLLASHPDPKSVKARALVDVLCCVKVGPLTS